MTYLAAEALIAERLAERLPGGTHVLTAADLAGVEARAQLTPAAHVVYDGDRLGDAGGRGLAQVVWQRWLVVIAVRNRREALSGAAAREDAGTLIAAALAALAGWAPSASHGPLARVQAPRPAYEAGFLYVPLAFETRLITVGA
jgi:hypothetical protein